MDSGQHAAGQRNYDMDLMIRIDRFNVVVAMQPISTFMDQDSASETSFIVDAYHRMRQPQIWCPFWLLLSARLRMSRQRPVHPQRPILGNRLYPPFCV